MDQAETLFVAFDSVEDPRIDRRKQHPLGEVLFLVLSSVICGVQSWCGVEEFGNDRLDWLRKYYPYEAGIPSHDTIGRVMSLLKPGCLVKAYAQFMSALFNVPEGEIIALDGKTLRRSFDKASGQKPLHILNAWAVKSGLALGQLQVDAKTNEITAVPDLLDMIDVRHATITVDALNTQKTIAEKVISLGADYALPVKGNHKNLQDEIQLAFDTTPQTTTDPMCFKETVEKGHGRIETRRFRVLGLDGVTAASEWKGLIAIGRAETNIENGDKSSSESRYYLLSFHDVGRFAEVVRGHWGVENSLHWVLDVTFREDDCRVRTDHAPANFSTIRKLALNLIRSEKSKKLSVPIKQAKAARRTDYLELILETARI